MIHIYIHRYICVYVDFRGYVFNVPDVSMPAVSRSHNSLNFFPSLSVSLALAFSLPLTPSLSHSLSPSLCSLHLLLQGEGLLEV